MANIYYEAIDAMEKAGVDIDYINGWAAGFLHHPRRGEQHITDAYEAGYADGREGNIEGYHAWRKSAA